MKRLGLIGGTSWLSTAQYYSRLNQLASEVEPGHTASLVLYNTEWHSFNALDWEGRYAHHLSASLALGAAGAEAIVICANTLHRFLPRLAQEQPLPVLSIIDAVAADVSQSGWQTAGVIGTSVTMSEPFYCGRLAELGIKTLSPPPEEFAEIDRTIFEEFANDVFTPRTVDYYLGLISALKEAGAECVVLGCTEIPLLLQGKSAALPMIDTIESHCRAAIRFATE